MHVRSRPRDLQSLALYFIGASIGFSPDPLTGLAGRSEAPSPADSAAWATVFPLTLDPALDRFPAVSDDGRLVAFNSLRGAPTTDIWVIPLNGGEAEQVTFGKGSDSEPAWSPDGKMIAYTSTEAGDWDIWITSYPGGSLAQITDDAFTDLHPSWSPDGTKLAFHSNRGGDHDIWVVDIASKMFSKMPTGPGPNFAPEWSPNGRRMVYWSRRDGHADIYVLDIADMKEHRLTTNPAGDRDPAYSPTGNRIVFHSNRANEGQGSNDLYMYSLGVVTRLTDFDEAHEEFCDWAADGNRIVFQTNLGGDRDIWVLDLKTTTPILELSWGGVKEYFAP